MRNLKMLLCTLLCLGLATASYAHKPDVGNPGINHNNNNNNQTGVSFRADCAPATARIDQDINNVRARLLTGGDLWWDGSGDGKYVVPAVEPGSGLPEVSSIFAGAVWLGGVDPGGNLKVAAQTYGSSSSSYDFWPGPLTELEGTVEPDTCRRWDRFFTINREDILEHLRLYNEAVNDSIAYDPDLIPQDIKKWPAIGNDFFFDEYGFELPTAPQGLASFFDRDEDGIYEPEDGDYPRIDIRGCEAAVFPDQMIFWIYNDNGNIHTESQGTPIRMEVQVQAFAYATNDEINNMTFLRYKLINRATEFIDSTFFAMWVDPDLGCHLDDFIGCDTSRSLAYVYNEDLLDGQPGCACDGGVNTYCDKVPILGVDYFRGPIAPKVFGPNGELLDPEPGQTPDTLVELGMSSFTYYNNGGIPGSEPGTTDPSIAVEYYRYLSGSWQDGLPFTYGSDGHDETGTSTDLIDYAFTEPPNDDNGWSMCTSGLPFGDRRTVQASGPFRLDPGAVNELIVGAVWVPDQSYPCPDISQLLFADDIAQALFDNCFEIVDGPDAPDLDFIELDQQVVFLMTNDSVTSNNANELYTGKDLKAPEFIEGPTGTVPNEDTLYRFEGYQIYQMRNESTQITDEDDIRLVAQYDIRNDILSLVNWTEVPPGDSGLDELFYEPEVKVEATNEGIKHTFIVTDDKFASGDGRLVNHKKYYYSAVAYAFNEYLPYDPSTRIGQRNPYLEGRNNVQTYTVIPRPITTKNLNSFYGDGPTITRVEGLGVSDQFVDISDEERERMVREYPNYDGRVEYLPAEGPINVTVFNPLGVKNGNFRLTIKDADTSDDDLDPGAIWELTNIDNGEVIAAEKSIDVLNEQLIGEYGFSVAITQNPDAGDEPGGNNGALGIEVDYKDKTKGEWLFMIPDGFIVDPDIPTGANFTNTQAGEAYFDEDFNQALSSMGNGEFVPYTLAEFDNPAFGVGELPYVTPGWTDGAENQNIVHTQNPVSSLNNVDIVFTSDKDLWSRCVVVETANFQYTDPANGIGLETVLDSEIEDYFNINDGLKHMDLRGEYAVGKDGQRDNTVDVDGDPRVGMSWFPGYAVDVETGQRLNIFFGENSVFNENLFSNGAEAYQNSNVVGADMLFNPSSQPLNFQALVDFSDDQIFQLLLGAAYYGGQHFVYVTDEPYDECEEIYYRLHPQETSALKKVNALAKVKWAGLPILPTGQSMESVDNGLIPNDVIVKVRVNNTYQVSEMNAGPDGGYPTYEFSFEGQECTPLTSNADLESALQAINVVPNPYYGFSDYENTSSQNIVKITNLPAVATITIFSLDGKHIRQYKRNEAGAVNNSNNAPISESQVVPALEWDLRNTKGIPISSGVYLIHVDAPGLGERVIKWFGVGRKFDPSGL